MKYRKNYLAPAIREVDLLLEEDFLDSTVSRTEWIRSTGQDVDEYDFTDTPFWSE